MPIYEYQCKDCSLRFEVKKRFRDSSDAVCPKCHGEAQRVFSPVPIFFKGSGFYATDNARGGNATRRRRNGDRPAMERNEASRDDRSEREATS